MQIVELISTNCQLIWHHSLLMIWFETNQKKIISFFKKFNYNICQEMKEAHTYFLSLTEK